MKILITLLSLMIVSQIHAFDLEHKFGIGGSFGYPVPIFGNNFNDIADPKWSVSAYGRYHFTQSLGMDLGVSREKFKDTPLVFKNINTLLFWRTSGAADFTPVIGLGAGVTSIKEYTPKSAKLSLLARAGFEYGFMPALSLSGLIDYQYVSKIFGDMPTGRAHVLIPQVALTLYFGGEHKEEPKTEIKEEKKPEVPEKEKVSEADTVSSVSAATQREERENILNVEFASNKYSIEAKYMDKLKNIADQVKGNDRVVSVIEGRADKTGRKESNAELSKKRAEAVKKELMNLGVAENKIQTDAYGDERPIGDNHTKAGRQQNRSAAVYIITKPNVM